MTRILEADSLIAALQAGRAPYHEAYLAMYSSLLDGIVTDPMFMVIPIDDHIVHRGDGVFEAFRCVGGRLYNVAAHVKRLQRSAAVLRLTLPVSDEELEARVVDTVRAGQARDCTVYLYVSRGPGGFGVSPGESAGQQLYVVAIRTREAFMTTHPQGARVAASGLAPKAEPFTGIKSTNYVTNVLMTGESMERGVDYVVGFDAHGHMTEAATQNAGVVTGDGALVFPELARTLCGTTMMRVMDLARPLIETGRLRDVRMGPVSRATIASAREMLLVGTTNGVVAVTEFDGRPVGTGKPGAVYRALAARLQDDMRENRALLTEVFA